MYPGRNHEYWNPKYGALRLQWVSMDVGGWTHARTRGYWRIIASPYRHASRINRLRPGEVVIDSTGQCTEDYAGGFWGWQEPWAEIKQEWQAIMRRPVRTLKKYL